MGQYRGSQAGCDLFVAELRDLKSSPLTRSPRPASSFTRATPWAQWSHQCARWHARVVHLGGVYEAHSDDSAVKYYGVMGQTVAMRAVPAGGSAGTLPFPLADHLGSTTAVTGSTGAAVATQAYWPYGAQRSASGITQTDKLYTGQQREQGDPALGLYNYKARFYSTTLARFVSADTVADGLNRYVYVHGNPLRYTDPAGLTPCTGPPSPCA